jgi:hypothetical protein
MESEFKVGEIALSIAQNDEDTFALHVVLEASKNGFVTQMLASTNSPYEVTDYIFSISRDYSGGTRFIRAFDITSVISSTKECECGKDKHGFARHSNWCVKYE